MMQDTVQRQVLSTRTQVVTDMEILLQVRRLMSYYNWHYLDKGRVAQGHNSAEVDTDGKTYLVYHTRFNDGSEGHEVRVHQLFTAGNGGLVATPFEYSGRHYQILHTQ